MKHLFSVVFIFLLTIGPTIFSNHEWREHPSSAAALPTLKVLLSIKAKLYGSLSGRRLVADTTVGRASLPATCRNIYPATLT